MLVRAIREKILFFGPGADLRGFAFFVLVPLALAVTTATTTGYNRTLGIGGALLYVGLLSLPPWWLGEGATRLVWCAARKYRPPLWCVCGHGVLLSCVVVGPYAWLVTSLFKSYWPYGEGAALLGAASGNHVQEGVIQVARAIFFWVSANYIFDRLLDYPRFRYDDFGGRDTPAAGEPKPSELLERLSRIDALTDILIVKAEEHYVRIYGVQTEEFITYQFGAAVKDLAEQDGFQVHRSYWVRQSAIVSTRSTGSNLMLEMSNGVLVPVSQPYHALVRQVLRQPGSD
ncbi:MAG: LytTR family DNA-binding domain-containing protein [Pseudomonadota bacterium]